MYEVTDLMTAQIEEYARNKARVSPCRSNRASELGHPCLRYLCYVRLAWRDREPPSPTLQVIFDDGSLHERYVLRLIEDIGYDLQETQKSFEWPKYQITGHLDAKIWVNLDGKRILVPVEVKSTNDPTFKSINSQEDLNSPGKRFWVGKWGGQVQLYMLLDDSPYGILVLKNKAPAGVFPIKAIPLMLDYGMCEALLKKAEAVNAVVREWEHQAEAGVDDPDALDLLLPDRMSPNEDVCGRCDFLHRCMGVREFGPELIIMTSEEILESVRRREELAGPSAEYREVHEHLRQAVINAGGNVLVGGYHMTIDGRKALRVVEV